MELRADATVAFPRDAVFAAYRDRLPDTVHHLPNIRRIVVLSREEADGEILLVNEWTGGGDIPSVARAFLNESMLKWTDHAAWNGSAREVAWRTDVHAFPGAFKSSGKNRFIETGPSSTRLEIRGELTVDAAKIPGVPRLLSKSVAAAVEKFFVGQIALNGVAVARAVERLLESA